MSQRNKFTSAQSQGCLENSELETSDLKTSDLENSELETSDLETSNPLKNEKWLKLREWIFIYDNYRDQPRIAGR